MHGMSYNIVNEIGITYSSETEMNSPDKNLVQRTVEHYGSQKLSS